jgi:hypothetical protein
MWVAIHVCMEATLGISLCTYLYLKLAKTLSFLLPLMSSTKSENKRAEQVLPRRRIGGRCPKQCNIHVSKCKNDKIK